VLSLLDARVRRVLGEHSNQSHGPIVTHTLDRDPLAVRCDCRMPT
jgi:hypothetical protein